MSGSLRAAHIRPRATRRSRVTRLAVAAALAAAPVGAVALAAPASAADTGTVTVVHGVPGLPVDVYVNGKDELPGFQPGTVSSPLSLPAATYKIEIRKAGAAATSAPAITGSADLTAGANVSLVAHLSASGTPELSVYANDVSAPPAGQARLYVRHDAAAPAVDILAGGSPVLKGVTNPKEGSLVVPAGTVSAAVALAGTTAPVIGPASLTLPAGSITAVYAVGSATDKTLGLVVQTVGAGASGAAAGTGGQAASGGGGDVPLVLALGLSGAAVLAVTARRYARVGSRRG